MNTNNIKFEASYGLTSQLPEPCGSEFAFVGRSNVGKSSLINKLFDRKALARVRFADLPGYGYAKVAKDEKRRFSELINGYFSLDRPLEVVFVLMDMRHEPSPDDKNMVDFLIENEIPFVVVLTKCDKLGKKQQEEMKKTILRSLDCDEGLTMIPFSAITGQGAAEIREIVDEVLTDDDNL